MATTNLWWIGSALSSTAIRFTPHHAEPPPPSANQLHGKNRIPYWIDRRLTGLARTQYHAIISFGLPIEPEDSQYGEYRYIS